jgi:hypothetical protein
MPRFGCWFNRDPIEEQGGLNLYGFVNNNPVLYFDYLGELTVFGAVAAAVIGGAIGGVSAALTGGDVLAGIAGGAVSGACIAFCPWAAVKCGALGGATSGFISGIRSANRDKLCGARWKVRVVGSVVISTATGAFFGKIGEGLSELGAWTRTIQSGSLSVSIEINGPNILTSFSGGVSSTAAELIMIKVPEAIIDTGTTIFEETDRKTEHLNLELEASGIFN